MFRKVGSNKEGYSEIGTDFDSNSKKISKRLVSFFSKNNEINLGEATGFSHKTTKNSYQSADIREGNSEDFGQNRAEIGKQYRELEKKTERGIKDLEKSLIKINLKLNENHDKNHLQERKGKIEAKIAEINSFIEERQKILKDLQTKIENDSGVKEDSIEIEKIEFRIKLNDCKISFSKLKKPTTDFLGLHLIERYNKTENILKIIKAMEFEENSDDLRKELLHEAENEIFTLMSN